MKVASVKEAKVSDTPYQVDISLSMYTSCNG